MIIWQKIQEQIAIPILGRSCLWNFIFPGRRSAQIPAEMPNYLWFENACQESGPGDRMLLQHSANLICSCSVLAKTYYFPHYSNFGSSPCRSFWLLKTLTAACLWFTCLRPLPGEVAVKELFCQSRGREMQRIPWAAGGRGDEGRQSLGEDRIWGFHFMSLHPSTCVLQSGGLMSNSLSSPCQRTPSD